MKNTIKAMHVEAKVLLFGSRTDDNKRGGDIDILVIGERKLTLSEIINIRVEFWKKFGEQKLDIVSFSADEKSAFKSLALQDAIEL